MTLHSSTFYLSFNLFFRFPKIKEGYIVRINDMRLILGLFVLLTIFRVDMEIFWLEGRVEAIENVTVVCGGPGEEITPLGGVQPEELQWGEDDNRLGSS